MSRCKVNINRLVLLEEARLALVGKWANIGTVVALTEFEAVQAAFTFAFDTSLSCAFGFGPLTKATFLFQSFLPSDQLVHWNDEDFHGVEYKQLLANDAAHVIRLIG